MKKVFLQMLIFATILTITSCGGDDEPKDSLMGSEWTHALSERVEHIQFTSESAVEYYHTKDGALIGNVGKGTYSKDGNTITFHNFKGNYNTTIYIFKSGVISGNNMEVDYVQEMNNYPLSTTYRRVK